MARKLPNWLEALAEFVEDTEAPRIWWLWGGIFTICAAMRRKVWLRYGLDSIYPNLYLMIVAPPGERKSGPPSLAKKMLEKIDIPVAVDSSSKRVITEALEEASKTEYFFWEGKQKSMATLAIISKELSSLLAVDPKGIIELLTDLYDPHDIWKYKTANKGDDFLYNVCVSCFVVTTPTWLMGNLPDEAIGGGYTSRNVIISGGDRYKLVPWPANPDNRLYEKLISDLVSISNLVGEFEIVPEAKMIFETWYNKIPAMAKQCKDVRVAPFLNRMHVIALKVAMAIHISASDTLIIEPVDISQAIELVTGVIAMAGLALGGHGRSKLGPDIERVLRMLRTLGTTTKKELYSMNYTDLSITEFEEVLKGLITMGRCKALWVDAINDMQLTYLKEKDTNN